MIPSWAQVSLDQEILCYSIERSLRLQQLGVLNLKTKAKAFGGKTDETCTLVLYTIARKLCSVKGPFQPP